MPLPSSDFSNGKDVYFTEAFKTMIRSERESLIRESTEFPAIPPNELFAYRYDIYRLLRSLGVPSYLWWTTAFINGIENPFADVSGLKVLRKVNEESLSNRIARSNTVQA